jgi:phosphoglycolate phosphatase
MTYQLIVFDWDGTLFDSLAYIVNRVQKVAKIAELTPPDEALIRSQIGLSVNESLRRLFPDLSPMQACELIKTYQAYQPDPEDQQPALFNGTKDVLQTLNDTGYWLAIATGKPRAGLDQNLIDLNLNDCFMCTRTADETDSKPNPAMLLEILDKLGVMPERALVVGDTEYDMYMAQNANVDALAVSYGSHDADAMTNIDNVKGVIHDISELPGWLASQNVDKD